MMKTLIAITIPLGVILRKFTKVHKPIIKYEKRKWSLVNFGQTQSWSPSAVISPKTKEDLIEFIQNRKKNNVTKIKAFGGLHSWSDCAVTDGVNIDTKKLNKVLHIDRDNLRIKAEAGILLKDLYVAMRENEMAIPAMPNIEIITLGGAVSNGTHGTRLNYGSFTSLVHEIELIDAKGKLWTLTRDSKDPTISRYFDAALISFGSLGMIYSITLQCVEEFNMINIRSKNRFSEMKGNFVKVAHKYDSCMFFVRENTDEVFTIINEKIDAACTESVAKRMNKTKKSRVWEIMYWTLIRIKKLVNFGQKSFGNSFNSVACVNWDKYEILHHTRPFVNMEYSLPEEKLEEAIDTIHRLFKDQEKTTGEKRDLLFCIRPVGADVRGYLSSTRRDNGSPSYYIDIPYQSSASEIEKGTFLKIEQELLAIGGRCSFSRLFWTHNPSVLKNFWDKDGVEWKKVKLELDPEHIFTNKMVEDIFFSEEKIRV